MAITLVREPRRRSVTVPFVRLRASIASETTATTPRVADACPRVLRGLTAGRTPSTVTVVEADLAEVLPAEPVAVAV